MVINNRLLIYHLFLAEMQRILPDYSVSPECSIEAIGGMLVNKVKERGKTNSNIVTTAIKVFNRLNLKDCKTVIVGLFSDMTMHLTIMEDKTNEQTHLEDCAV